MSLGLEDFMRIILSVLLVFGIMTGLSSAMWGGHRGWHGYGYGYNGGGAPCGWYGYGQPGPQGAPPAAPGTTPPAAPNATPPATPQ